MPNEKTYPGLVILTHCTRDGASKVQASQTLTASEAVLRFAAQWDHELERRRPTQPSQFSPTLDNTYSLSKPFWQGIHSVRVDADVNTFLSARGLFILCADTTPFCSALGNFSQPLRL